jgi:transposase
VRSARLWARLLGVEGAIIGRVWFDDQAEAVVVAARPRKHLLGRCGVCARRCGGFDRGEGRRRWRALDLGTFKAFVEADAPRVSCPEHGVVVAGVPWARHGARHTHAFDDTAAWLAVHTSKQAVGQLLGVAWETVGRVVARVAADAVLCADPFHVVKWATDALDEVRCQVWNTARKGGDTALAGELKGAR